MTTDLFGAPPPTPASAKPAGPAPEAPPVFGSRAWTNCPCGGFATLHFPNSGGARRCHPCATAEGRMKGADQ